MRKRFDATSTKRARLGLGRQNRTLTDRDRCRLGSLLVSRETEGFGNSRSQFELETSLEEADTISAEFAPRELVTMNSTVGLVDAETGKRQLCTLVYPEDRDLVRNGVGVLQRLGLGLLGRRVGDVVKVRSGPRTRTFRIDSLLYQPEAAGDTHL